MKLWQKIKSIFSTPPSAPTIPADKPYVETLHPSALALILEFEGMDQPSKWPGVSSGITLGHGYDLGYHSAPQFREDWSSHLTPAQFRRLLPALGVRGTEAAKLASQFKDITITKAMAADVFSRSSVPAMIRMTRSAFPGAAQLPSLAFGVLCSLVYNRGGAIDGPKRIEMLRIKGAIARYATNAQGLRPTLLTIASNLRSMTRLWPTVRGLRRRREAEATLMETLL